MSRRRRVVSPVWSGRRLWQIWTTPCPRTYDLTIKLEHLQVTGSFKPRGAFSVLTAAEIPAAGVVAASGGNFGIAVAYAASRLGHPATIFVPESSPAEKIGRIGAHGADVRIIPGFYDEAREASVEFAAASGAFTAHAYDQHEVVAGQGTLARELEQQCDFDVVLVAVGGGGLIGGIASWLRDRATVVAVEPERCPTLHDALNARRAGRCRRWWHCGVVTRCASHRGSSVGRSRLDRSLGVGG